jgi:hypothetical protein
MNLTPDLLWPRGTSHAWEDRPERPEVPENRGRRRWRWGEGRYDWQAP